MLSINFLAIIVAAVVAFILGFLFHGPVSGKLWMKLAGVHPTGNEKLSGMVPQMLSNFVANIASALALSVVYFYASSSPVLAGKGIWGGVICAFWVWLGFSFASGSIEVIWMGRKKALWIFESACSLIVILVMGAIIAAW